MIGRVMHLYGSPVLYRARIVREHFEVHHEPRCREKGVGCDEPVAPCHLVAFDGSDIERTAIARHGALRIAILHTKAAYTYAKTLWRKHELVTHARGTAVHRSSRNQTGSLDVERTIDGQPKALLVGDRAVEPSGVRERGPQLRHAEIGERRNCKNGRTVEERSGDECVDRASCLIQLFGADHVRLRDSDDSASQAEQVQDADVLPRLRHDAIVGSHGEQRDLTRRKHRKHVWYEA